MIAPESESPRLLNRSRPGRGLVVALLALAVLAGPVVLAEDDPEVEAEGESASQEGESTDARRRWKAPKPGYSRLNSRWRQLDAFGVQLPRGSLIDPYNQNPIKGDFPIIGDRTFLVLDVLDTPAFVTSSQSGVDNAVNNQYFVSAEIFGGSTVFRPKDWAFKVTARGLNARNGEDVDEGPDLNELFAQVKLADIGPYYDSASLRGGIQFFKSDFDGFVLQDFNLGALAFGEYNENRYQWNAGFVDVQEKGDAGGVTFDDLDQDVYFVNWFWQDFIRPGFNIVFSAHRNQDDVILGEELDVTYLGLSSAGHWGRVEVNPTLYYAFGDLDVGGATVDVKAWLAGVLGAYTLDYMNFRAAIFAASGDDDPADGDAEGFDAITDNIALFGGNVGFVIGGGEFGTRANSFLPSFRAVGTRSNFNNPGIMLVNGGWDAVLTPTLFFESNVNYFKFMDEDGIPVLGFDGTPVDSDALGMEVNAAFTYRVFLNENLVVKLGANLFLPDDAAEQLLGDDDNIFSSNLNVVALF